MDFGPLSMAAVNRMDAACDAFESDWRRGRRTRIEDLLVDDGGAESLELFRALLALELELRRSDGERPSPHEYRARFPRQRNLIDAVFSGVETADVGGIESKVDLVGHPGAEGSIPLAIGRYLVLAKLGAGGQGQVFRVVHPGLGRDFVLKLARAPVAIDRAGRDRMLAEGRLLSELDHPNLVRVLDLDFHDDHPFVVMEYIAGRTLLQHTSARRPTPRRAAAVVAELARVVEYVHGHGVVHQDITPSNVLIDEAGRPRLIDFGLAQLRDAWSDGGDGPTAGTPQFMAPEQARGEAERVGPATDVFALGGLLFFLLTGQPPFRGQTAAEIRARAGRCEFDRAAMDGREIPRSLVRIVLRAMAAEPADRYPRAGDLAGALERFVARPRRLIRFTAVAALVLISFGAWRCWDRVGPENRLAASDPPSAAGEVRSKTTHPASPAPAPARLILKLVIDHWSRFDEKRYDRVDTLGEQSFGTRLGDDLTVRVELSEPAYAYLIAFRPDGVAELCHPDDEAISPPATRYPRYPPAVKPDDVYRLDNGGGLQAFAVVVSRQPLPAFRRWKPRLDSSPWRAGLPADPGVIWRYDEQGLGLLTADNGTGSRSKGAKPRGSGGVVSELARWLRDQPGIDAVAIEAFAVSPIPGRGAMIIPFD